LGSDNNVAGVVGNISLEIGLGRIVIVSERLVQNNSGTENCFDGSHFILRTDVNPISVRLLLGADVGTRHYDLVTHFPAILGGIIIEMEQCATSKRINGQL